MPRVPVPEVLEDGVTAHLGRTTEDLIAAVGRVGELDRRTCRETFERRFTSLKM